MIVLDTNVLSEPLRASPDPAVLAWLSRATDTATTSVTAGELAAGALALPEGQRRTGLVQAIGALLDELGSRVLAYDAPAAAEYGVVLAERRAAGLGMSSQDAMIAAICRTRGASLATRNVRDFEGLGIDLVNSWD